MNKAPFFYGWVILAVSFFTLTTYGLFFSYGVFFKPMAIDFGWSVGATSTAYSIYMVVYSIAAIPVGWLFDKYGPRLPLLLGSLLIGVGISLCSRTASIWHLYLLFGVVAAMGHGAIYVVPISTLSRWFIARRGLAVGIATAGIGVGISIVPLLVERLIALYNWRTAFVVIGILYLFIIAVAVILIRRRPQEMGLKPFGESTDKLTSVAPQSLDTLKKSPERRDFTVKEALKSKAFWSLYPSFSFVFAAESLVVVLVVPFGIDLGIPAIVATGALALMGIGNIGGRVVMGALSDRIGRRRMLTISFALQAIAILFFLAVKNAGMLYVLMAFLGIGFGGWAAMFGPIWGDLFGLTHMGKLLGVGMTAGAVSGLIGPALGGYIVDWTHSYYYAFLFAGMLCVVAVVLSLLARPAAVSEVKVTGNER